MSRRKSARRDPLRRILKPVHPHSSRFPSTQEQKTGDELIEAIKSNPEKLNALAREIGQFDPYEEA